MAETLSGIEADEHSAACVADRTGNFHDAVHNAGGWHVEYRDGAVKGAALKYRAKTEGAMFITAWRRWCSVKR